MKDRVFTLPISGPQHIGVPHEIIENYQRLYQVIKEKFPNKQFSRFFPMVGNSYDDAKIKLMLVGRSPNGWTELKETSAKDDSSKVEKSDASSAENSFDDEELK